MTDNHDPDTNIRRVGAKDRKTRLASGGPLIPPEEPTPPAASDTVPILPDETRAVEGSAASDPADPHAVFRRPTEQAAPPPVPPQPIEQSGRTRRVQTPPAKPAKNVPDPDARFKRPARKQPPPPSEKPQPYVATMPTVLEERFPPIDLTVDPPDMALPPSGAQAINRYANTRKRGKARLYNRVAMLFVLLTVGVLIYYAILWFDPNSILNPLPPYASVIVVTATPQGGVQPTEPSIAAAPTLPPVPLESPTPSPYPFKLVDAGVIYMPNGNGEGCNWASIAGTVTGLDGRGLEGYAVQITGGARGLMPINDRVFSNSALTYGEGGFELVLGGAPQVGDYQVQLFTAAGVPVSEVYPVSTFAECERNVALVNFVQTR